MEVISPSTKKKDQILKLNKYRGAGVREYWTIDLYEESVTVYDFARDNCRVFSFADNVPLRISDGLLCVDFGEICREMHSYFGCD